MNKLKFACLTIVMAAASENIFAGGLLTNTNQSVAFLRNPARDAAIGIDGVYSNPAGVAFLEDGLHLSLNIQNAHQTRTVTSTFDAFKYGLNNNGSSTKTFEGTADAPVIPSIHAAYNKNNWSFQFNFAVTGGGGKCVFENGLASLESHVAMLPLISQNLDALSTQLGLGSLGLPTVTGYSMDTYMRGRQYYYGFTLGAAYKVNKNLSIYGGLRLLYGSANYYGYIKNIQAQVNSNGTSTTVAAQQAFNNYASAATEAVGTYTAYAQQAAASGNTEAAAQYTAAAKTAATQAAVLSALGNATGDVTLNCDQTGWGIAPIIGVDYKTGKLNLAAKFEFETTMKLKNKAANSESAKNFELLDRWQDGITVNENSPALLTIGAQYEILPELRVSAGWHHYFDKEAESVLNHQANLGGDTNEYLFGAEYDINKWVQVSAGAQLTRYDFTDDYMEDLSFNVSSYSFGLGVGIRLSEKLKLNLAYFQTNYETYERQNNNYYNLSNMAGEIIGAVATNLGMTSEQSAAAATTTKTMLTTPGTNGNSLLHGADSFTRTNRVIGIGLDIKI